MKHGQQSSGLHEVNALCWMPHRFESRLKGDQGSGINVLELAAIITLRHGHSNMMAARGC